MAEIRVERRKKPVWPWFLGFLGVVILAFILINRSANHTNNDQVAMNESGKGQGAAGGKVNAANCVEQLKEFANENTSASDMSNVAKGLNYLSCSLDELARKNNIKDPALQSRIKSLKNQTGGLRTPYDSKAIEKSFKESAHILDEIQSEKFPGLESQVNQVMKAAEEFDQSKEESDLTKEISNYFDKASQTVSAMNNQRK